MVGRDIIGLVVAGCGIVGVISGAGAAFADPIPLVSYNFNEGTGTSATNGGSAASANADMLNSATASNWTATDLHGATGSGVSGKAGDYALNLSSADAMGRNASTALANAMLKLSNTGAAPLKSMQSFTLTCWFKADEVIDGAARLFDFSTASGGFTVYSGSAGSITVAINGDGVGRNGVASGFTDVGAWVFFAATYDSNKASNNLIIYKGTADGTLTQVASSTVTSGAIAIPAGTSANLLVGNAYGTRPFDGYMDNIAIYGSATNDGSGALSQDQLKAVMATAVPEPAAVSLLAGGVIGLGVMKMGRRE